MQVKTFITRISPLACQMSEKYQNRVRLPFCKRARMAYRFQQQYFRGHISQDFVTQCILRLISVPSISVANRAVYNFRPCKYLTAQPLFSNLC